MATKTIDPELAAPAPWMGARHALGELQRAAERLQAMSERHPELAEALGSFPGLAAEAARAHRLRLREEER